MNDYEILKMEEVKRQRAAQISELDAIEMENYERSERIERYRRQDVDRDGLDDGMEVQVGLHDDDNKPRHTLAGVSSPGPAFVQNGAVQFPYSSHAVDLRIRKPSGIGGKSGKMNLKVPTPRTMGLSVDFGHQNAHHKNEVSMGDNIISPHKYRMETKRAQNAVVGHIEASSKRIGVKNSAFSRKFVEEHSVGKNKKSVESSSVNSLVERLNDFVRPSKGKTVNFDLNNIKSSIGGKKKVEKRKSNKSHDAVNDLVSRLSHGVKSGNKKENSMVDRMNDFVSLKKKRVLI